LFLETLKKFNFRGQGHPLATYLRGNMKRVLIIESNPTTAEMARCLIENSVNVSCESVSDTYQAIDALCDRDFDYVVLSHSDHGIRGLELIRNVDSFIGLEPVLSEQDKFYQKTPVIILCDKNFKLPTHFSLNHFEIVDCLRHDLLGKFATIAV
jgi:CheY-like chemotaxis protein